MEADRKTHQEEIRASQEQMARWATTSFSIVIS
jgi:hypothetical protein